MPQSPFFSIVVPTFNRANFLKGTVESILNQTFDEFEVIIVDDGSTDETRAVMKTITDPRVKYEYKKNEERAAARNRGAQLSSGRYINFFDSDDRLYPNHLSTAYDYVDKHSDPEVFHLGYDVRDDRNRLIKKVDNLSGDINLGLIRGNFLSCNGVFLRRDIALGHPFNPDRALSASEDYELWLRLASRFRIRYDNTITSTIQNHDARSVLGVNRDSLITRIERLISYLQQDEAFVQKYARFNALFQSELHTYVALHLALTKEHRKDVIGQLLKSVRTYPPIIFTRRFLASLKHLL